jgi:hypothetical protein
VLHNRILRIALTFFGALLATFPASAFEQTTTWFSIVVQYDVESHAPLYLSNGSEGARLERYRSGDPTQMWALVQPDYPTAPGVTVSGDNSSGDAVDCVTELGCPFSGHGGSLVKIVNRASGGCLILGKYNATTTACESTGKVSTREKWATQIEAVALVRGNYSAFGASAGAGKCLTSDGARNKSPDLLRVSGGDCAGNTWSQLFTLQPAAEITCRTDWNWNICFVEGQGR